MDCKNPLTDRIETYYQIREIAIDHGLHEGATSHELVEWLRLRLLELSELQQSDLH
jgi:hypothetical protein